MPNEPTDLIRVGEAAALLGVTTETVRNWTKRGKLAALQTPTGQFLYRRTDVEACLVPIGTTDEVGAA
jgi:excisionase family DNA binding protein